MKIEEVKGSIVAIVTPMLKNGDIDSGAFTALMQWHADCGTAGIVVAGTTGESPTLTMAENQKLIAQAVKWSKGNMPIIGGVGANSTAEAISLTQQAAADGADAGLSVVPYYNRPPQEGLLRHFTEIAECSDLPIILYDVPKRCAASLQDDTVLRLAEHPNICGIKDATGDIERLRRLKSAAPDNFLFYSGDDGTAADYMLAGGHGVISVTANIAPDKMQKMSEAAISGDEAATRESDAVLRAFHSAQSAQSNPIPVKWALAEEGRIGHALRLPLVELAQQHQATVHDAAEQCRKEGS